MQESTATAYGDPKNEDSFSSNKFIELNDIGYINLGGKYDTLCLVQSSKLDMSGNLLE